MYQVDIINDSKAVTRRLVKSSDRDYVMHRIVAYLLWVGVDDFKTERQQHEGSTVQNVIELKYIHPITNIEGIIQIVKN